jgi:ribosome-associated protein
MEPFSVQGLEDGQWIVIDASDVVVHIFYEPLRAHYDLEGLWA